MNITKVITLALLLLFISGCSYKKYFKYDLPISKENSSYIQGMITNNHLSDKPYYLILYKLDEESEKLVDFSTHVNDGYFYFTVIPGTYRLYAIQEPSKLSKEKRAFVFQSQDIIIQKETNCSSLNVEVAMSPFPQNIEKFDVLVSSSEEQSLFNKIVHNQITTLDNSIFNKHNATIGLWNPKRFIEEVGGGIYFLSEYDPKKIPLLFIHGMVGSPNNFDTIIHNIDQTKFQILLYYYPSGSNLNYTIDALKSKFDLLLQEYPFNKLYIIAHSMGGLVAHGFINTYKKRLDIPLFISLATPWNGQKFAQLGGEGVGKVVPAFGNLYPGSAFQKKLYMTPFPNNLDYHLFFGYRGKKSLILDNSNDGVISLSSQLFEMVQKQSKKLYGYNLNHREILHDTNVILQINEILHKKLIKESQ